LSYVAERGAAGDFRRLFILTQAKELLVAEIGGMGMES
jgi:hypothetical protein